ncbi:MAG: HipA N-terminal domain-containing protein [Planctomycetota bacterium]
MHLEEIPVGLLSERDDGKTSFGFLDSYRRVARRPVLSQSFEDDLQRKYLSKREGSLPAFFANLVPEGKLRAILVKTFGLTEQDDLSLLEIAARDMPGATSLVRTDLEASQGSDEALVGDGAESTNGAHTSGLRFSLAAVQLKFSMLREGECFLLPGHDLRGQWIVNPGSSEFPGVVENEWSMLAWARAAGMTVPESVIVPYRALPGLHALIPEGTSALAVKRYDR